MPAAPPKGNKNAEKWDYYSSYDLFVKAIDLANSRNIKDLKDKDGKITGQIETSYKYDFIGEVARELKLYKSIFTELKNKFPDLQPLHTQLVETLEANCFCNSKNGHIKEATAIVNLKSNHKWTDRQQNEVLNKNLDLTNLSDEEIEERIKKAQKVIND